MKTDTRFGLYAIDLHKFSQFGGKMTFYFIFKMLKTC